MDDDAGTLPPKQDFSGWFNDILWRAEIMDVRYPVKGLYVWYPYGFAIRKFVYNRLRELLDRDHQETLFPLLIPEQEFMKEAEHIKGFEDEVYWVTHGGTTPLDVKLALRPTSETAIYPMYALWLRSHADLPMKYYQIVNTFRYETKQTRPLIRLREITSFMESHTVHATWDEAEAQVEYELGLTKEFYDGLCIPITISKRPDWDKFPGADYTIAVDAIMPGGKTLQMRHRPPPRHALLEDILRSTTRTRTGSSSSQTRPATGSRSGASLPSSACTATTKGLSSRRPLHRSRQSSSRSRSASGTMTCSLRHRNWNLISRLPGSG